MERMSSEERREYESWKQFVVSMMMGARNIGLSVPDRYRRVLLRAMVRHIIQQYCSGQDYEIQHVYSCYEKWAGEAYIEDDTEAF